MVGASSGRLDNIGRLDFSRGRGWKSISVMLASFPDNHSRTGSHSVLEHRRPTAPVMVFMMLFSCTSTRLVCVGLQFLQTGAQ